MTSLAVSFLPRHLLRSHNSGPPAAYAAQASSWTCVAEYANLVRSKYICSLFYAFRNNQITSIHRSKTSIYTLNHTVIFHITHTMADQSAPRQSPPRQSAWEKTKHGGKSAFDKAWSGFEKLGVPVNKLTNKIGSEAFWPTTLDHESDKAARILKSFCSKFLSSSKQFEQRTNRNRGWLLQGRACLAWSEGGTQGQTKGSREDPPESNSELCRSRNLHCDANRALGQWGRWFRSLDCEKGRWDLVSPFRDPNPHTWSGVYGWY